MYPAWSPDGRTIAYYSARPIEFGPFPPDTVIYNVKGLYETFARDGYRPSWSPDGRQILAHFRSERGNYEKIGRASCREGRKESMKVTHIQGVIIIKRATY